MADRSFRCDSTCAINDRPHAMTTFVPTVSDRHRALGVLCIGAGLLFALLFFPLVKPWWQAESRRWNLQARIDIAQHTLAKAVEIDAEFAARREDLLASGAYLPEPTIALANASLVQRLQQAAENSATDDSVCVLGNRMPVEEKAGSPACEEVRLRAGMQCGGAALQRFLQALETTPPRLRIDRMTIALAPNPLGFDKPMAANQPLKVDFDVVGCLFPAALIAGDRAAGR